MGYELTGGFVSAARHTRSRATRPGLLQVCIGHYASGGFSNPRDGQTPCFLLEISDQVDHGSDGPIVVCLDLLILVSLWFARSAKCNRTR